MGGVEKKARRQHRTLSFLDETGHSFRARPGTTWARRGHTPLLCRLSKRRECSSVVLVTRAGRLCARHFPGSIDSEKLIRALRYFHRRIGRPLLIVWDRLNVHRSRRTRAFLEAHRGRFATDFLPAYAPELNPEEGCNGVVKKAMESIVPESIEELTDRARDEFRRLQHRPDLVRSFFRHSGLGVTRIQ